MGLGIEIGHWDWGFGIGIGNWDWGLGIGIGIEIRDGDWGLELVIWIGY